MAAVIRSCSISTSPDFTASGSILRLSNCLRPSILTVTVPPPDEASTTISCIFLCSVSYCCLACDISCWRLNPPIAPSLLLVPLVDDGANLGAEFFLQAAHDGIVFGAPAAATIGCILAACRCGLCGAPGQNFEFCCFAQGAAGGCDDQALGVGAQRHVDNGGRGGDFDDDFVSFDGPFADFKHRDQHPVSGFGHCVEDGASDAVETGRGRAELGHNLWLGFAQFGCAWIKRSLRCRFGRGVGGGASHDDGCG